MNRSENRRLGRQRLWKNLQGDKAVELRLPGFEDETHTALADELEDFKLREMLRSVPHALAARRFGGGALTGFGREGCLHQKGTWTKPLSGASAGIGPPHFGTVV